MAKTVVGLYEDYRDAERVVRELEDNGFPRDDISLMAQDATHGNQPPMEGEGSEHQDVKEGAAAGAGTGAVLGGLAGLLVGLGALAIPGLGPIIAAGPLAAALAGAGVGAVTGGIVGALVDAGVPEEQAQSYAEGIRRGGTLVAVRTGGEQSEQARAIMNRYHPVDMQQQAREWRNATQASAMGATTTDMDRDSTPYSRDLGVHDADRRDWSTHDRDVAGGGTPALSESELAGQTTQAQEPAGQGPDYSGVGHGSWETRDVSSLVSSEHASSMERGFQDQGLRQAEQGSGDFDMGPEPWLIPDEEQHGSQFQGQDMGQASGTGGAMFQGEAMDRSRGEDQTQSLGQGMSAASSGQFQGQGMDQPTNQDMDRQSAGQEMGVGGQRAFSFFTGDFRNHYEMVYQAQGYDYTYYEPAYRYGYDLANADRYRGHRWTEIEPEARRAWEQHNPGYGWDYFKDAVRHGWERTTSQSGGMQTGADQGTAWSGSDFGTGTNSDQFTGSNNP